MRIVSLTLLVACYPYLAFSNDDITINAKNLDGGVIPEHYDRVNIISGNGNFQKNFYLPSPKKSMEVSIKSSADFGSSVHHELLRINNFPIKNGDYIKFEYLPTQNRWEIWAETPQTPLTNGNQIVLDGQSLIQYFISDVDYTNQVHLPVGDESVDGTYVNINNSSEKGTDVKKDSNLLENNVYLTKNTNLLFQYNNRYQGWHLVRESSYTPTLLSVDLPNGIVPENLPVLSSVQVHDSSFPTALTLPANPTPGQTIVIENNQYDSLVIEVASDQPPYRVTKGEKYVFGYNPNEGWQAISSPMHVYRDLSLFSRGN